MCVPHLGRSVLAMSLDAPNSVQGPLPSALASGVQVDKAFLNSVMADPSLAPAGHGHGHDSDEDSIDDGIWEKVSSWTLGEYAACTLRSL